MMSFFSLYFIFCKFKLWMDYMEAVSKEHSFNNHFSNHPWYQSLYVFVDTVGYSERIGECAELSSEFTLNKNTTLSIFLTHCQSFFTKHTPETQSWKHRILQNVFISSDQILEMHRTQCCMVGIAQFCL